jgi:hypothetical protein
MSLPVYNKKLESKYSKFARLASRQIDSLCFNRTTAIGWDNLTQFQRDIIEEVCELQATFIYDNEDLIKATLASYSINGVKQTSLTASWSIFTEHGICMERSTYAMLQQTGLTCRIV